MTTNSHHQPTTDRRSAVDAGSHRSPTWTRPVRVGAVVLTVVTMVPAIMASIAPLHAPNQNQELGFPVVSAPIGLFMVFVAARMALRGRDLWPRLLAATGILWTLNALLVAVRSLGVNGHVPHGLFMADTWAEQWFYVLPDLAAFVVLPMALPGGRIPVKWRIPVGAILVAGAAQVFAGALGSGLMDDTYLANPLAAGHNSWIATRDDLYVPTLLIGLIVVVVRGVASRRTSSVPMCAALVIGVVAILVSTLAEGMLESASRPGWVPWVPVAVAVPFAVALWARVAKRTP